ncbi:hypothetical protein, partial [Vibrio crassostreae]|uniref:hypothetical protein n=1 Tax=Vibrio crassostreae TaxID=246167 RepID=UPI004067BA88
MRFGVRVGHGDLIHDIDKGHGELNGEIFKRIIAHQDVVRQFEWFGLMVCETKRELFGKVVGDLIHKAH